MSAQQNEKQNLCMNAYDEYENIAVVIDSGASETVASVEKFESYPLEKTTASGMTCSLAVGKEAEEIVHVGQRYTRIVDEHGTVGQVPDVQRVWSTGEQNLDTRWVFRDRDIQN